MILPEYWLQRPNVNEDDRTSSMFDLFLQKAITKGNCAPIDYDLPFPKWQFLCHIAEHCDIALHGSGNPDIVRFEPRKPIDVTSFGSQEAVYAAADGVWPIFFAVADRDTYAMSTINACISLSNGEGKRSAPFYFFSLVADALARHPWRSGTVYLLPRKTFHLQPPEHLGGVEVRIPQLASSSPVTPLARLTVEPSDFPFLAQVRGHDDGRFRDYAVAVQTGAPLPR